MNSDIEKVLYLSGDAYIGIRQHKIVFHNPAAATLFATKLDGILDSIVLPGYLCIPRENDFVSTCTINGTVCSVSTSTVGDMLVVALVPDTVKERRTILSEPLIASMRSSLFNIELSIDRLNLRSDALRGPENEKYLSILYHNYYSIKRLVGNISTYTAIKNKNFTIFPRRVDLVRLCSDLVSSVALVMDKKVALHFSCTLSAYAAVVDPDCIERMLLNMIANSFDSIRESGNITLDFRTNEENIVFSVQDDGVGIPSDALKNLFTRFEEDTPDLTQKMSCGLGLYVARGIAEAHNGSLMVESKVQVGTTVRAMLPLESGVIGLFASAQVEYGSPKMESILTELAPELDRKYYTAKYMD